MDTSHHRRLYSPRWMSSSFHVNLETLSSTVIISQGLLVLVRGMGGGRWLAFLFSYFYIIYFIKRGVKNDIEFSWRIQIQIRMSWYFIISSQMIINSSRVAAVLLAIIIIRDFFVFSPYYHRLKDNILLTKHIVYRRKVWRWRICSRKKDHSEGRKNKIK